MRIEIARLPSRRSGISKVWKRNFLQFRKSLLVNLFWIVLEPLFYLVALGYGLGSFIPTISGVAYADFFFPGLLCITAMMVAFFVATYDCYSKLTHQKIYRTMILTPITPEQIVLGEILWAATKGTLSAFGVATIAFFFGHVDSWMILPALVVVFLSAVVFGAIGMIVTSIVRKFDSIIYVTAGFIIARSLFSGSYFSIKELPLGLEYLSYLFPLSHSVNLARGLILDQRLDWMHAVNFAVLFILAVVLSRIAVRRFNKHLIK